MKCIPFITAAFLSCCIYQTTLPVYLINNSSKQQTITIRDGSQELAHKTLQPGTVEFIALPRMPVIPKYTVIQEGDRSSEISKEVQNVRHTGETMLGDETVLYIGNLSFYCNPPSPHSYAVLDSDLRYPEDDCTPDSEDRHHRKARYHITAKEVAKLKEKMAVAYEKATIGD